MNSPGAAGNALPAPSGFLLHADDAGLALRKRGQRGAGLIVDFTTIDRRTGSGALSRKQPLARAFGATCSTVFDATAGLGQDAFLLALLGYRVTACERSPVLFPLLEDGLRRARLEEDLAKLLDERLTLLAGDSRARLPECAPPPDAVYLDPMFPPKKKSSALAPQSIRWVRELVGEDRDARALFEVALVVARKRVVVKRPHHVRPEEDVLADLGRRVDHSCAGNLVRYDVYLTSGAR